MSLFEITILALEVLGVAAGLGYLVLTRNQVLEIRRVGLFFTFWAAVFLFEYYFLGPNSYIHMNDEGDHFIPYYLNILNNHLGGQFAHNVGGGHDIVTSLSPGIQLITPELILLDTLPLWLAILAHKFIVVGVGFVGAYLLSRRAMGSSVTVAAILGALYTVSNENLVYMTYTIGSGLAFYPLLVYVIVWRSENHPHYFSRALLTSAVAALYLDLTHAVIPAFVTLVLAAFLLKRINLRAFYGTVILAIAIAINWSEVLYGMRLVAPLTERGALPVEVHGIFSELADAIVLSLHRAWENRVILVALGALVVLFLTRNEIRYRGMAAVVGLFVAFLFFVVFPWEVVGIGEVRKLSHHYIFLGISTFTVMLAAAAAATFRLPIAGWRTAHDAGAAVILAAVTVGMLVFFKGYNFANLIYHGGQAQYRTIDNLVDPKWMEDKQLRVITLRVRDIGPEPALAYGNYGLEALDVFLMLTPRERSRYIREGVMRGTHNVGQVDPRIFIDWSRWNDGAIENFHEQVSFPLLRLANVGFILSPVPIRDSQLRLVDQPASPPITRHAIKNAPRAYLKERLRRLFDFNDMYVYALEDPFPVAFAAKRIVTVDDTVSDTEFFSVLERETRLGARPVVAHSSIAENLAPAVPTSTVLSTEKVVDGYDVQVNAPEGGVIALNVPNSPFWTATADGKRIRLWPVNFIQLGAKVPKGTKRIEFRYDRPTLADRLF